MLMRSDVDIKNKYFLKLNITSSNYSSNWIYFLIFVFSKTFNQEYASFIKYNEFYVLALLFYVTGFH